MLLLAAPFFFLSHYSVTHASETASSLTTDAKGNAYVVSYEDHQGHPQGFLSKLDRDGRLIYHVAPLDVALTWGVKSVPDGEGNVYALVSSVAAGPSGCIPASEGGSAAFAIKLDPAGNSVYRFCLGTPYVSALAVGSDGSVYITGSSYPASLHTTPGAMVPGSDATPDQVNAFVIKLNPEGSRVVYSTFLSPRTANSLLANGLAIAVDGQGFANITGLTEGNSIFIAKLNPQGSAFSYPAVIASSQANALSGHDTPTAIRVDSAGNTLVTIASDPGTSPATVKTRQLSSDGRRVVPELSLTLKGTSQLALTPDGQGNVLVTGIVTGSDFPLTDGALRNGATFAAIVSWIDGTLVYSTRLPYSAGGAGVAPDGSGGFIVLGSTNVTQGFLASVLPIVHQSWVVTRFTKEAQPGATVLGTANIAESNLSSKIAPGEIVSIFGLNLGPAARQDAEFDPSGHLPFQLAGTEVYFNGIQAPLLSVGNQQVNAVVPFAVIGGQTARVELRVAGVASSSVNVPLGAAEPQMFLGTPDLLGFVYAAAVNEDGTINSEQNPAKTGSIVAVFINGAGLLSPSPEDGSQGRLGQQPTLPISVAYSTIYHISRLPAQTADVIYAGAAPGEVAGLLQVNSRVPAVFGPAAITVQIGDELTTASIWVQ